MKKLLSLLLCLAIVFSSMPIGVIAEDTQSEESSAFSLSENQEESIEEENQEEIIEEEQPQEEVIEETIQEEIEEKLPEENIQVNQNSENDKIEEENELIELFQLVESQIIDNIKITVNGTFAEEGTLSIKKVESQELSENNIAESYSFDIKVLNKDNQEIQPIDKIHVSFEFEEIFDNLDIEVFHEEEPLEAETKENTVIVESNGFSIYTVEFTYGDKEYVLDGDSYVKLYDLLSTIGLNGEVTSWEVSNSSLFNIFKGTEDEVSYDYEIIDEYIYETPIDNPDGDTLYLVPLQMFNTEEWLKVVIEGIEYEIKVTDDNIYQNVPASYSGNISTNSDDNLSITGDTYFLNAPKPNYVMQSQSTTSATDFAAGLPLSTIFIDVDKIGNAGNIGVQGEFKLLTENEAIRNGFEHHYTTDGSGGNAGITGDVVVYNPLADTENLMQIEPNKINVLEGDLFQFIYRDAAILPNGSRAHVKIVYSNAKIAVDQRLGVTDAASGLTASNYQGAIYLVRGGTVARGGTDNRYMGYKNQSTTTYPNQPFTQAQRKAMQEAVDNTLSTNWGQSFSTGNANTADTIALGQSIDVKYQVVDDDGNPVDGTFIFAVTGINLDRDPYSVSGNNICKPIWGHTVDNPDVHFFSEAMSINQGKVSDYIYVRPNTNVFESNELKQKAEASNPPSQKLSYYYAQVIEDVNGHVKFIGNGYGPSNLGGDDNSYNSGFVVLANAKEGITVTSTGHATTKQGMNTQAWGGVQIWYRYISWTGPGGNIQTTSEGNYGGTLNDTSDHDVSSNILDAGTYVVPEGKDVTYTMSPNDGYQIKRLRVKNSSGSLREIKFNGKALSTMTEGQTYSFNDAAGNRCTLTALADGKFKLVMPYAEKDEEVRVEWERTNAEVKVKKSTVGDVSGTFNFKIRAQKKEDITTYTPELIGSVWKDPETGLFQMQLSEGVNWDLGTEGLNELVARLSSTTYVEKLTIEEADYSWGQTLWKTDSNLSDLGFEFDDDLFVGFANIASSVEEENIATALNIGYSAAGPERIYLYNPKTNLNKDVITYWNFNSLKEQKTNPGWYSFTVDAGDEKALTVQRGYTYEVTEENDANWELLDINGSPIESATGILNDDINNPEHEFLNREVPDLTIKKETINDAPGTFEFKVKVWREAEEVNTQFYYMSWMEPSTPESDFIYNDVRYIASDTPTGTTHPIDGWLYIIVGPEENTWNREDYPTIGALSVTPTADVIRDNIDKIAVYINGQMYPLSDINVTDITDMGYNSVKFYYSFGDTTIVENPVDLSSQFGDLDSDGYYHFTLNNGASLNIPNLPYGSKYEVIEVEQDGWKLTDKENDTGEITNNTTATFTNEKMLSLTFGKEVTGNMGDKTKEFEFEVKVFGEKRLFSDEIGEYLPANSYFGGTAGILFKRPELNQSLFEAHFNKFESGNLSDLKGHLETDTYCRFDTGLIYESPGDYDTNFGLPSLNNGDVYYSVLYGYGVGNLGEHYSIDYPQSIEGIENTKRGTIFAPDWIDLEEYGGEYKGGGVFRFNLKHNETITIPDIPYGYSYEIIEKDYSEEGYEQKVDGQVGREVSGELTEDKEHEFENKLQVVVPTKIALYDNYMYIIILLISITSLLIIARRELKK